MLPPCNLIEFRILKNLYRELYRSFPSSRIPEPEKLLRKGKYWRAMDEEDIVFVYGNKSWKEISRMEDFTLPGGGIDAMIVFLTDEAYHYYFPSFLKVTLDMEYRNKTGWADNITLMYNMDLRNLDKFRSRSWIGLFTKQQKQICAKFLLFSGRFLLMKYIEDERIDVKNNISEFEETIEYSYEINDLDYIRQLHQDIEYFEVLNIYWKEYLGKNEYDESITRLEIWKI